MIKSTGILIVLLGIVALAMVGNNVISQAKVPVSLPTQPQTSAMMFTQPLLYDRSIPSPEEPRFQVQVAILQTSDLSRVPVKGCAVSIYPQQAEDSTSGSIAHSDHRGMVSWWLPAGRYHILPDCRQHPTQMMESPVTYLIRVQADGTILMQNCQDPVPWIGTKLVKSTQQGAEFQYQACRDIHASPAGARA